MTATTLLTDLESYWKLDTNNATQPDEQSNHDASVVGATYSASGKLNGCYVMDGDSSYLNAGNWTWPATWSISCWVKTSHSAWNSLVCRRTAAVLHFRFVINASGYLALYLYDGDSSVCGSSTLDDTDITDGDWHHVGVSSSGANITLYRDGSPVAQTTDHVLCNADDVDIDTYIGSEEDNIGTNDLDGSIDELGIWHRCLTDAEFSSLYNSGDGLPYSSFGGVTSNVLKINIGDSWKESPLQKINIGDTWKTVEGIKINIGDSWKTIL